jgi:hypothetical protein
MGRVQRVNVDRFTTGEVTSLNVAAVDANAVGFSGGFTDGRYGYLVPYANAGGKHGRVARIDLQNFATSGVAILNLQSVAADLVGFRSGFTSGRFGYFVQAANNSGPAGKLVRVDLDNFAPAGVSVLDLTSVDPQLVGLLSGVTNGRYAMVVTRTHAHGKVARIDLANFTTAGVTVLDLATVDAGLVGFYGAFTDGRYGYAVPFDNPAGPSGKIARIDLANFTSSGVTFLDMAAVDPALKGFVGSFTDGRYAWLPPYLNRKAARLDLNDFSPSGVEAVDLTAIDPSATSCFTGFTNGRYGIFVPFASTSGAGSKVMRVQMFQGPGNM